MFYAGKFYREEFLVNPRSFDGAREVIQLHSYFNSVLEKGFESHGRQVPVPYVLYCLNLNGSYQRIQGDRKNTVPPGTFTVLFGLQKNWTLRVVSKAPLERKCCLVYHNKIHDMIMASLGLTDGAVIQLSDVPAVHSIMDSIYRTMQNPSYHEAHLAGLLFELLQEVYSQSRNNCLPEPLNKALEYINANFTVNTLSCEEISRYAGISTRSLNRLFQEYMNSSVTPYINNIRLEHACTLLSRSHLQINEIAEKCGYGNAGFMSRQFRRKYHRTPSEYRLNG